MGRLGPAASVVGEVEGRLHSGSHAGWQLTATEVGDAGDVVDAEGPAGHSSHLDPAVDDLEVVGGRFELVAGDLEDLVPEHLGHADDGAARHGGGPASPGSDQVERRGTGVAVDDPDALEGQGELVGGQLGQGGLVALPVGHLAGEDGDRAVGLQPGVGLLVASGRRPRAQGAGEVRRAGRCVDAAREADAQVAALAAGIGLGGPALVVADAVAGLEERLAHGDADQVGSVDHGPGKLLVGPQVGQPVLDGVPAEGSGQQVEHALAGPGLGFPRPAVGHRGRLVGRHHHRLEGVVVEPVGAREEGPRHHGERRGRQGHERVGAGIDGHADLEGGQAAVGPDGGLDVEGLLPGLAARQQVLTAVGDPPDRRGRASGWPRRGPRPRGAGRPSDRRIRRCRGRGSAPGAPAS